MERMQEDNLNKVKDLKRSYEEKIFTIQKDIIDKDTQIDEFNLKINDH